MEGEEKHKSKKVWPLRKYTHFNDCSQFSVLFDQSAWVRSVCARMLRLLVCGSIIRGSTAPQKHIFVVPELSQAMKKFSWFSWLHVPTQ